jgi:hypothetical protein
MMAAMTARLSSLALTWLLLALAPLAGVLAQPDDLHRAGLIVDFGDGHSSYAIVEFAEPEISGVDLLRLSGIDLVTIEFGGLGQGVCQIGETGCGVSDCRQRLCQSASRDSPYWRYFRLAESGAWTPHAFGGSSVRVEDGMVEGWSWTPDEPSLPALSLVEIERLLEQHASDDSGGIVTLDEAGRAVMADEAVEVSLTMYIVAALLIFILLSGVVALSFRKRRQVLPDAA